MEDDGDYYNPLSMIGVATSEEEGEKMIERRKAELDERSLRSRDFYTYPAPLNEFDRP